MPTSLAATKPTTVDQYLQSLPLDRRQAMSAVRAVILKNLDADYEEGIQYGMIGYYVPHRIHPAGYHCDPSKPLPFVMLGATKGHMALHLMPAYVGPGGEPGEGDYARWFKASWLAAGKKLDMGKACVRFKKLEDVPLSVLGEAIRKVPAAQWIATMESVVGQSKTKAKKKPITKIARKKVAK